MAKDFACMRVGEEWWLLKWISKTVTLDSRQIATFIEIAQIRQNPCWLTRNKLSLMLQDFQKCDRLKLNSSSVALLRWTMTTSLANEVFGQIHFIDYLWASFNAMYFVNQRSPRGNECWNMSSFVERSWLRSPTKPSGKIVVVLVLQYIQLRWTKPTSFTNKALGKNLFSTLFLCTN